MLHSATSNQERGLTAVAKIVTKARQLRLSHQAKLGRAVSLREVSEATGIERAALNRIELGKTAGIDFETLVKLCQFYGVGVGEILEYDPSQIGMPGLVATAR
jgi:DNA-binding Xre family transcriptional regulator